MSALQEIIKAKPKHEQVADHIKEQIVSGALSEGHRLMPDHALARQYRVNRHTVAAGLNSLVKEGLLARAPGRGTIVTAPREEANCSNAVGMVMLGEGDVYGDLAQHLTAGLLRRSLYPVLINQNLLCDHSNVAPFLDALISGRERPYGFLVDGGIPFPFDYFKGKIDSFPNTVFINTFHQAERIAAAKYVLVDYTEAGRLAARHFIALGHRRMAFLGVRERHYQGVWGSVQAQILAGFAEECRKRSVAFSDDVFWSLLHGASFDTTVGALLAQEDRPTAIFTYYDATINAHLLPFLVAKGLRPMRDVELVGFYNTHHAVECGFSSFSIQETKIAEAAVQLLTSETAAKEIWVQPELIVRHGRGG